HSQRQSTQRGRRRISIGMFGTITGKVEGFCGFAIDRFSCAFCALAVYIMVAFLLRIGSLKDSFVREREPLAQPTALAVSGKFEWFVVGSCCWAVRAEGRLFWLLQKVRSYSFQVFLGTRQTHYRVSRISPFEYLCKKAYIESGMVAFRPDTSLALMLFQQAQR